VPFDLFAPGSAQTLVLLSARVGGLVLVAPVFSTKAVPTSVRTVLIILLTVLMQPMALAQATSVPQITPATFLGETLVGLALGIGAAILIGAASLAGDLMGTTIGLSGAAVFNPMSNTQENVLGQFASLFAVAMLLALDAHIVMIDAVARSVRVIPVGSALSPEGIHQLVKSAGMIFALGLQFAAPVIAAVLIANTSLAILGRAAPALNILSIAFPIQIGIGLVGLAASIPFIGSFYRGWSGIYMTTMDRVLAALAHGGM
jgi:flagellar biosynthetic protein FliR